MKYNLPAVAVIQVTYVAEATSVAVVSVATPVPVTVAVSETMQETISVNQRSLWSTAQ